MKAHLPTDKEFIIFRDEDGDYVIRDKEHPHIIIHGNDPNDAVDRIVEVAKDWEKFDAEADTA